MAFPINEYPYTDLHEMNMDYVLKQVKGIPEYVESSLAEAITHLTLNGVYDADTETLTITLTEVTP